MEIKNLFGYAAALSLLSIGLLSCEKPAEDDDNGGNPPTVTVRYSVKVTEVTETSAKAEVACVGSETATWYAFVTEDLTADTDEVIASEVAGLEDIASVLKSGNAVVEFTGLTAGTGYRVIVTGLDADGNVSGNDEEEFKTDRDPDVWVENPDWSVEYVDRGMYNLGYVEKIEDVIRRRRNKVDIELFFDVEPDPSLDTVEAGVELMRKFEPDTIIAIGGGSPMDAAKVMWLMYEHPEVCFDDIKQKFMDIRKRAFKFPELGKKAKLICIPTTSGTGSEVTPFAVITDKRANKKYPLTDYALTPTVAIVDPEFVMSLPASIAADTGIDVLTHAMEAYVSILASDFTDGWAKQAVKLVFDYLEESVNKGTPLAREKMHNAATIAGMAFANAFLGMNHSLAHKIGGEFHVPHGRTNGILLPHVIRYNGSIPTKLNIWPKIENYKADVKYMELAQLIGLKPKTPAEGVEMFANAVEELMAKVHLASNFKSQGIDKKDWDEAIHRIAMNAYEDQCTPANPRMPMVKDMEEILRVSWDYENKYAKK